MRGFIGIAPDPTGAKGQVVELKARDGHSLHAWCASPPHKPKWGVVILQEIFGVNDHIRETCKCYAAYGALAIAPALFDRVKRGVELAYDNEGIQVGRKLREQIGWDAAMADVRAAVDYISDEMRLPTTVVGYCWGGTLAFLAATRLKNVVCAVSYYGGQTVPFASEPIKAPVLMHFGREDPRIPEADRKIILANNPEIEAHLYPADHGFNCNHRKEWHAPSAELAMQRTIDFIDRHVGSDRLKATGQSKIEGV